MADEPLDAPDPEVPEAGELPDDGEPPDDGEIADLGGMRGVELSAEELAAIREATSASMTPGSVLIVSRPEDREQWSIDLDGAGLDLVFVGEPHQLLIALRDRDVESVIIDADACPSGGLPLLAALRNAGERLTQRIVVASRPTRTHVVSCLAAGATAYLVRPFAVEKLLEQLRG
ncbi:MAG: hypothetical protein IAG13_04585 [Deltaproteobacteria bacterium]|nr:hypothetical protein [Nannocystaceae bacterium]